MFTSASFPALAESPGSHLRAIKKQHELCNCVELFACLCGDMLLELPGDLNQILNPTALWGPAVAPQDSSSSCRGTGGTRGLLSETIGRQTKQRAIAVTYSSNGATV